MGFWETQVVNMDPLTVEHLDRGFAYMSAPWLIQSLMCLWGWNTHFGQGLDGHIEWEGPLTPGKREAKWTSSS